MISKLKPRIVPFLNKGEKSPAFMPGEKYHAPVKGAAYPMVSKELKKLSRRELVDIIYQLKQNEEQMQAELAAAQEALQDKRMRLSMVGSIAEAAVSVSNIFNSAQTAADLYLQEIACMKQDAETECARMINEAKQKSAEIMAECQKQYSRYRLELEKLQQEIRQAEETLKR